jgi:hypothetical protein
LNSYIRVFKNSSVNHSFNAGIASSPAYFTVKIGPTPAPAPAPAPEDRQKK